MVETKTLIERAKFAYRREQTRDKIEYRRLIEDKILLMFGDATIFVVEEKDDIILAKVENLVFRVHEYCDEDDIINPEFALIKICPICGTLFNEFIFSIESLGRELTSSSQCTDDGHELIILPPEGAMEQIEKATKQQKQKKAKQQPLSETDLHVYEILKKSPKPLTLGELETLTKIDAHKLYEEHLQNLIHAEKVVEHGEEDGTRRYLANQSLHEEVGVGVGWERILKLKGAKPEEIAEIRKTMDGANNLILNMMLGIGRTEK